MNTRTQREQIRAHLERHGSITPLDALDSYGCFRLGARIHELKTVEGLDISSTLERANGKRYARYTLHAQ